MSTLSVIACCRPLAAPSLSDDEAHETACLFKALADPARVKIVNLLAAGGEGACVCDLTETLGLSQPTVSHHLKKLTDAGLVFAQRREGPWTYYRVVPDALAGLANVISPDGPSAP